MHAPAWALWAVPVIVVQSVHRTPPTPTRPRVWTPNAAGLLTPDIELTEGGIYVSAATMDEVEAEKAARVPCGDLYWYMVYPDKPPTPLYTMDQR